MINQESNSNYTILTGSTHVELAHTVNQWLEAEPGWQTAGRPFTEDGVWYQAVWSRN